MLIQLLSPFLVYSVCIVFIIADFEKLIGLVSRMISL